MLTSNSICGPKTSNILIKISKFLLDDDDDGTEEVN